MIFHSVQLGNIVEGIYDGPHATPPRTHYGPVFLGISSLQDGRLDLSVSDHLSESDFKKWTRRVQPQPGDIVFSYETRLGQAAMIPKGLRCCLGRRMGLLRPDRSRVDPRFLLYAFLAPEFQATLRSRTVHGSTVDRILLTEIADFPIRIPKSLLVQKAIAYVLGALDDKIELNRRMNRTLEDIAQTLFRAWFLDFEGETDLVESELGPIPRGWKVSELADYIELAYGKALPKKSRQTGDVEVYGSGGQAGVHATSIVEGPGVVVGRKGTVGTVYWVNRDFWPIDTTFYVIRRGSIRSLVWIYHRLLAMDLERLAADSAVPGINRNAIYRQKWCVPENYQLVEEFDKVASVLMEKLRLNLDQSRTLADLRDTLLPKLISGEIRVPEAEEAVQEAV